MSVLLIIALWQACLLALAAAGAGHNHGDEEFEWAGIFEVPDAKYMWTAQKVEGKYADASMKIAALPAAAATADALKALESEGKHSLGTTCITLQSGGVIVPKDDTCYKLSFNADLWQSLYTVDASNTTVVAFFTEHVPTEFESTAHYLKDGTGEDIEPVAEMPEEEPAKADWGASIGAAILVNIVTLVGVALAVPALKRLLSQNAAAFEGVLSAFAAGAILACAFFLLLFEATHLIAEGWKEEVEQVWRWGTMVIVGFVLPAFIESMAGMAMLAKKGEEKADVEADSGEATIRSRARGISAVSIGDFLHNLCDGFFIGAAFKSCSGSFGWGVTLATVLHEIPQELADYAILTSKSVGLTPVKALVINFLTGMSVLLGVVIINAADVANSDTGLLLAFGGGVYVYIAATECMSKLHHLQLSAKVHVGCLLAFIVGAILIGLILLDHKHCPSGGHAHGHEGHGH